MWTVVVWGDEGLVMAAFAVLRFLEFLYCECWCQFWWFVYDRELQFLEIFFSFNYLHKKIWKSGYESSNIRFDSSGSFRDVTPTRSTLFDNLRYMIFSHHLILNFSFRMFGNTSEKALKGLHNISCLTLLVIYNTVLQSWLWLDAITSHTRLLYIRYGISMKDNDDA